MKNCLKLASALMLISSLFFGCKGEVVTEYVTKEVERTYASAVTFTVSETNTEGDLSLTMQSATEGAVIYYTADGSTPTTDSSKYTSALTVNADAVYKAVAVKEGIENSPVSVAAVYIK
ncbi:MAG: chitobiase/beta-hexosaminidase C-terminal domain-containing protein [Treponema sp.]|nr:chitobiase/beta-hexosaminidase C-terminal domain-containing protein [Spirochaetales bacterium]MDY6190087.1 chitobiase/beta-hexosaminidase C-terminal domain-containing protein [Treponema sp.]